MLVSLLGFLFVLIVVVFVHEMGHYLAAKMQGIHVEVFSLGFGKELFRYTDKFGTRWQLSIVPLGGYVKFLGDDDVFSVSNHGDECKKKGSFSAAGNWRKIAVVLAGPFANFVLAAVIFSGLAFVYGKVSTEPVIGDISQDTPAWSSQFRIGDRILSIDGAPVVEYSDFMDVFSQTGVEISAEGKNKLSEIEVQRDNDILILKEKFIILPVVGALVSGGAAEEADIRVGDILQSISGQDIDDFRQIVKFIEKSAGNAVDIVVLRDGQRLPFHMTPVAHSVKDRSTGEMKEVFLIGVQTFSDYGLKPKMKDLNILQAIFAGAKECMNIVVHSLISIGDLLTWKGDVTDLSGPIRIAQISGEAVKAGFSPLLQLIGFISASVGFINLLPIPILDGGHVVLCLFQSVRGKEISQNVMNILMKIGIVFMITLMVFVTYNDLSRLW